MAAESSSGRHAGAHWGTEAVVSYLTRQRDLYRWLHDQAMRLANLGHTPDEIASAVKLPPGLWDYYLCHGYYGTVSLNLYVGETLQRLGQVWYLQEGFKLPWGTSWIPSH